MSLEVGSIVEGKISGITGFGAFVDLPEGKTGLVHISEVARNYVKDIKEHLSVGQVVKVKVLTVEPNGKISLSIKKAVETKAKAPAFSGVPAEVDFSRRSDEQFMALSFEEKMAKFKSTSDERMQDIKRNTDAKRGSYRRGSN
ncbi:MAG: S1 RNA-binding domain-containing protein [Clostridia bacterium]